MRGRKPTGTRTNLEGAAKALGVEKSLIRLAKKMGYPGFKANGSIDIDILGREIAEHRDELDEEARSGSTSIDDRLKEERLKLVQLQVRKMQGNLLDPDDVKKLFVELAAGVSMVIKKEVYELLPKIIGLAEPEAKIQFDKTVAAIFKSIKSGEIKVDKLSEQPT